MIVASPPLHSPLQPHQVDLLFICEIESIYSMPDQSWDRSGSMQLLVDKVWL